MIRLNGERLAGIIERELARVGVCEPGRLHVAASLVETSLRGVDSHGINLFPHYHAAVQAGRIKADPKLEILRQSPSSCLLDADHAFGHHAGSHAMELAMQLATDSGIGAVAVCNSTHFGAAGYFALQAARRGFCGFAFTNADALVRGANATAAIFGTNPFCFTAPLADEDPLCLDMATSLANWNKVRNLQATDSPLPQGWAADAHGQPTTDSAAARMLEPIGDYKGYGLGMVIEILCGMLTGGPIAHELLPMYTTSLSTRRHISHFFAALRIDAFQPLAHFEQRLQQLVTHIRGLEASTGQVMVPGDPEKRTREDRLLAGIPISEQNFASFVAISEGFASAVLTP